MVNLLNLLNRLNLGATQDLPNHTILYYSNTLINSKGSKGSTGLRHGYLGRRGEKQMILNLLNLLKSYLSENGE
jgi:hypothetical protein